MKTPLWPDIKYYTSSMPKKYKKAYVAGALTHHANSDQKETYLRIGDYCKKLGLKSAYVPCYMGTDPVKDPNVTPRKVWETDEREVREADLVVAYVGAPSLGTGGELEIARIAQNDIILWWYQGDVVSRLPLGNPAVIAKIEAINENDLFQQLKQIIHDRE